MKTILLLITFIYIISAQNIIKFSSSDTACVVASKVSIITPKCSNTTIGYTTTICNSTHVMDKICSDSSCNENCYESNFLEIDRCYLEPGIRNSVRYGCGDYKFKREGSTTAVYFSDKQCSKPTGETVVSEGCHLENKQASLLSCSRSFFHPLGYFSKTTYNGTTCTTNVDQVKEYQRGECISENNVHFMITACNTQPVDQILVVVVSLGAILIGCFGFFSMSLLFAFLSSKLRGPDEEEVEEGYNEI
eukprot:gene3742-6630_t